MGVQSHGKNHRKTMGKPWENHRKMVIFHGELDDFMELVWEKSEHRLNTMV